MTREQTREAANSEVERLTRKVAELYEGAEEQKQRIRQLIAERDTARLQADQNWNLRRELESLLGTDKIEEGVAAVTAMKDRIKRLEEAGDEMHRFCDAISADKWTKAKETKP